MRIKNLPQVVSPVPGDSLVGDFGATPATMRITLTQLKSFMDSGGIPVPGIFTDLTYSGVLTGGTGINYTDTGVLAALGTAVNGYNQMVMQNRSAGAAASSSYVTSNDGGTATTNYGEFGINSSAFSGTGSFSQPNNVYLAAATADLVIGTYANKVVRFVINSGATDAGYINASGWNGTVGATTPSTGAFTTLSTTGNVTIGGATQASAVTVKLVLENQSASADSYLQLANQAGGGGTIGSLIGGGIQFYTYTGFTGSETYTQRAALSSTGLSVTGALSSTDFYTMALNKGVIANGSAGSIGYGGGSSNVLGANIFCFGESHGSAPNQIQFRNSGNTTQATIDASGNLGIGVVPSAWGVGIGGYVQVAAQKGFGSAGDGVNYFNNAYNSGASVFKYSANGFANYHYAYQGAYVWANASSGLAGANVNGTGNFTTLMTLDGSGNLLVGQTSGGVQNSNSHSFSASGVQAISHINGTGGGTAYAIYGYNGTVVGSITQSGTTAVVYNTTSDHRLKTNVRDANAARFMDIQFRDFEWVDGRHDCGVIAHELQAVYPDLVLGEKDATEVRAIEITPAVPAVLDAEGVEVTPAIPAVTEDQTFPVYQQVNYQGLIGRMGTRVQVLQRTADAQAVLIEALAARIAALEASHA